MSAPPAGRPAPASGQPPPAAAISSVLVDFEAALAGLESTPQLPSGGLPGTGAALPGPQTALLSTPQTALLSGASAAPLPSQQLPAPGYAAPPEPTAGLPGLSLSGLETFAPAPAPPAAVASAAKGAPAKKRGPGRPSKVTPPPPLQRYGIVAKPSFAEDILELGSGQPMAFKRLFGFFDKLKVDQVLIHGTPTGLNFYTADSTELLRVRAEVQGSRMNHYYCGEEFWLSLNQAHVSKIFNCINKSFHCIRFIFRHTDHNVLMISLTDTTLGKDNYFPVTVNPAVSNPRWTELERFHGERDSYRVSWTIPQQAFKKCHEIATQTAVSIKVSLVAGGKLTLSYMGNGIQDFSETYQDSSKIKLRSLLQPGEVFAVDYSAIGGKTLSAATPAETVTIFCTEKKPLLFLSEDQEAGILVLTAMPPSDVP